MSEPRPPKKENFLLNLLFCIVLPILILSDTGRKYLEVWLNAEARLVVALAFPTVYFIQDYVRRRVANVLSVFGFAGTLLSGDIGLMKLDPFWFAVKEASFPALIGVGCYLSQLAGKPLVKAFVWNDTVMNTEKVAEAAAERGKSSELDALFGWCTAMLAPAFLASAVAHYVLARWVVTAHPLHAQDDFNAQLSRFNMIAWPAILLPSMAYLIWLVLKLVKRVSAVTGLPEDDLYRA